MKHKWRGGEEEGEIICGGGKVRIWEVKPENDDDGDEEEDDEFPTINLEGLQLKPEVSACSFCLDLITLRIDEPLILSVGSKWSRW